MTIIPSFSEQWPLPEEYGDRPTVKGVILNEQNEVLLFGDVLVGGGIEPNETPEQAMHRESLEEVGAAIRIIKPLGSVHQYRDVWRLRYVVQGFLAKCESMSEPTTNIVREKGRSIEWVKISYALEYLEGSIRKMQAEGNPDPSSDQYQAELYSMLTTQTFLREAQRYLVGEDHSDLR